MRPNNSLEPTLTAAENGDSNGHWCRGRVDEGEPSAVGRLSSRPLGSLAVLPVPEGW